MAFLIGAVLGLVGLYLRARVPDTAGLDTCARHRAVPRRPLLEAFRA